MSRRTGMACNVSPLVVLLLAQLLGAYGRAVQRSLAQCEAQSFSALQPTVTHAPVIDLQWLDKNDQDVWATTKKIGLDSGGLWISHDGATTFSDNTAAMNASINGAEPVDIMAIIAQKSIPSNVATIGSGTYIWVANNSPLVPRQNPTKWKGSGIKSLRVHPRHDNWLLVLVKRPDCKSLDHAQTECPHDLMLTQDLFGTTAWTNLTGNAGGKIVGFVDFDWAANLCPRGLEGCPVKVDDNAIFATMYEKPGDYDQSWDPDVHFVVSNDLFRSFSMHVRCGNMFELIANGIYLALANSCPTNVDGSKRKGSSAFPKGITLYTSIDGGSSFVQACLPVAIKQEGYELMETHDGSGAIVIVDFMINNGYMDIPASSVYTAGPHQALFSLSMTDVFHADFGFSTDFAKVEGLPGVYIGNQMIARAPGSSTAPASEAVDYYAGYDGYDISDTTDAPMVETHITFNGGGRWQKMPAPKVFNNPKCNRCDGKPSCFLHLNGMSAWDSMVSSLPSVYSNPSAPGFIMGTGNVGTDGVGLGDNDGLCTWLSTDGGVTWSDVGVGAYIYEFADWGSTIFMARHTGKMGTPAEEILFSVDYGRCWQSVPLTTALLVDNIRIEPDGQRPRVVVHGRACRQPLSDKCSYKADAVNSVTEGLMYTVDVTTLLAGKMGLCATQDYEMWSVPVSSSNRSPRCVLGRQMLVSRRRADTLCLNGPDYKRPQATNTTCNCTLETDMECDYGFIKTGAGPGSSSTVCSELPNARMPSCPVVESGEYSVSNSGYRLVHADKCIGAEKLIHDTDGKGHRNAVPGRGRRQHGPVFRFFMFILGCIVLSGIFTAWWIFMATEAHRDTVRDLVGGMASFFASLYLWAADKVASLRGQRSSGGAAGADHDLGYFQPLGEIPKHEAGVFTIR